jgi:hypothetical protein
VGQNPKNSRQAKRVGFAPEIRHESGHPSTSASAHKRSSTFSSAFWSAGCIAFALGLVDFDLVPISTINCDAVVRRSHHADTRERGVTGELQALVVERTAAISKAEIGLANLRVCSHLATRALCEGPPA